MQEVELFTKAVMLGQSNKLDDLYQSLDTFNELLDSDYGYENQSEIHRQIGKLYFKLSDINQSASHFNFGLEHTKMGTKTWCDIKLDQAQLNLTKQLGHLNNNAIYLDIIKYADNKTTNHAYIKAHIELGNAKYSDQERDKNDWHVKALSLAEDAGDIELQIQALIGLGKSELSGRSDSIDWFLVALDMARQNKYQTLEAQALISLGDIGYSDKYNATIDWYLQAIPITKQTGNHKLLVDALLGLGDKKANYIDGSQINFGPNTQLMWFKNALDVANQISDTKSQIKTLKKLINYFEHENDIPQMNFYLSELNRFTPPKKTGKRKSSDLVKDTQVDSNKLNTSSMFTRNKTNVSSSKNSDGKNKSL